MSEIVTRPGCNADLMSAPAKVWPDDSACNWTEDFAHENGMYSCECCQCGVMFIGHKRRVECKVCATASNI